MSKKPGQSLIEAHQQINRQQNITMKQTRISSKILAEIFTFDVLSALIFIILTRTANCHQTPISSFTILRASSNVNLGFLLLSINYNNGKKITLIWHNFTLDENMVVTLQIL